MSRAAFNYAKKHKIIKYNTFDDVEKIQPPKAQLNHLTINEIKEVLEVYNK